MDAEPIKEEEDQSPENQVPERVKKDDDDEFGSSEDSDPFELGDESP